MEPGDLVRRADGDAGEIVMQGIVPLLSRTPGRLTGWSRRPGWDNEAVLGQLLGYSPERAREVTSASGPTSAPGSLKRGMTSFAEELERVAPRLGVFRVVEAEQQQVTEPAHLFVDPVELLGHGGR